jgi:hypothetical protein
MIHVEWNEAGRRISDAMLRRGVSAAWVAHKAGLDRKTVDRVRKGDRIRLQSLTCIEEVLGLSLLNTNIVDREARGQTIAPPELGGYSREMFENYVGTYYMFRNSYDFKDRVICSCIEVSWNQDGGFLVYEENQDNKSPDGRRFRYKFNGKIAIPAGLSITQFLGSSGNGFHRVMTTTGLRGHETQYFKGILMGINEVADIGFHPATSPVFIEKASGPADPELIGSFLHNELWHESALHQLQSARGSFTAFY